MKINKINAISMAICCLIVALWSEAQGMEKQTDLFGPSIVRVGSTNHFSPQTVSDELTSAPILAPLVDLESSTTSWASYLLSPANSLILRTREAMNYATKNPRTAGLMALYFTCSAVVEAQSVLACVAYGVTPTPGGEEAFGPVVAGYAAGINCDPCVPHVAAWWASFQHPGAKLFGYSCLPVTPWNDSWSGGGY